MIFRWLRAESAPVPTVRILPFADVLAALPAESARVDAEQRSRVLAERRAAVARRFPR
jgi:hypothetical protein